MKLKEKKVFFLLILVLVLSCKQGSQANKLRFGRQEAQWVKKTMKKMTVEEKVGQMVALRYSGYFANRDSDYLKKLRTFIVDYKIGGLILFGGNIYETAYLTNTLQSMARVPLLIASDLERGLGSQVEGATEFPPLMAIGATGSEKLAYQMGKITALEARALGIHMTYAPVVDVNINPDNPIINTRSFGEDPKQVSRLARAFIKGCQENGLLATAKHFPGHGDTNVDSHSQLPTVNTARKQMEKVELYPYKQAIKAGVQAIMIAHLYVPNLDPTPNLPATLSPVIVNELLRKKLGFKGLVVTDAMDMGGITVAYQPEEAALKAVQAGVDIVLLPPEPEKVIKALVQAVKSGQISEERLDSSVKRILEAKARLGLHKGQSLRMDDLDKRIARREYLQQAERMFESSVTLVKNEENLIPLSEEFEKIAVFSLSSDPGDYFAGWVFTNEIEKRYPEAMSFYADRFTDREFNQAAAEKTSEADVVIFALFSRRQARKNTVDLEPGHVKLIRSITRRAARVIVVSFGSPYFLHHFPEVSAYLCAYGNSTQAQKAAVKALFGEIETKGKLPVSFPALYPLGYGVNLPKKASNQ